MADLLDRVVIEVEQEERGWMDSGVRIFVDEVTRLIAARLGRGDAPEWEMMMRLDGVPATVILTATDALGVVVARRVEVQAAGLSALGRPPSEPPAEP